MAPSRSARRAVVRNKLFPTVRQRLHEAFRLRGTHASAVKLLTTPPPPPRRLPIETPTNVWGEGAAGLTSVGSGRLHRDP